MSHPGHIALRLTLAVLMALWSPLWCCCRLRSGLDLLVGSHATCCTRALALHPESRSAESAAACPHCRVRQAAAAASECGSGGDGDCCRSAEDGPESLGGGPPRQDDGGSPCRCHEQGRDMVRDQSSPSLILVFTMDPLPPAGPAIVWTPDMAAERQRRFATFVAPSPPSTLLRLHTLLRN